MKTLKKHLLYALCAVSMLHECHASIERVKAFLTHPTTTHVRNRVILSSIFYAFVKMNERRIFSNNDAILEYMKQDQQTFPPLSTVVRRRLNSLLSEKNIPTQNIDFVCETPLGSQQRICSLLTSNGVTINIPKQQVDQIETLLLKQELSEEETLYFNQFLFSIGRELEQAKLYLNDAFFSRLRGDYNFKVFNSVWGACSMAYVWNIMREHGFFNKKLYFVIGAQLIIEALYNKTKQYLNYRQWINCHLHASQDAEILTAGITIYEKPQVLVNFNSAIHNNLISRFINRFSKKWAAFWATEQPHPEVMIPALKEQINHLKQVK